MFFPFQKIYLIFVIEGVKGGDGQDHLLPKSKLVFSQITGKKIGISRFTTKYDNFGMNLRNL